MIWRPVKIGVAVVLCCTQSVYGLQQHIMPSPVAIHSSDSLERIQEQARLQSRAQQGLWDLELTEEVSDVWDYWSFCVGAGVGYLTLTDVSGIREQLLWPDFRISLEKSWYIGERFTAMLDLAVMTPTVRLGCVINESSRVSVGCGFWLFGSAHLSLRYTSLPMMPVAQNNIVERIYLKKVLPLTPSISYDHCLTKNAFLRLTGSYDRLEVKMHVEPGKSVSNDLHRTRIWHWPQLSLSLHMKF